MPDVPSVTPISGPFPPDPSSIASIGLTPTLMTGLLVYFLRCHFADASRAQDPILRGLNWTDGPESPIQIESALRWSPERAGARPAVIVRPGDWTTETLSINDQFQGGLSRSGAEMYGTLIGGDHGVSCVSPAEGGDTAARLGYEVFSYLMGALPLIRARYAPQLVRIKAVKLGAPVIMDESRQHVAVEIPVVYKVSKTWLVFAEMPPIDRVAWNISPDLG